MGYKEYSKQYYLKNRDQILAKQNEYNIAHREEKRLRDRIAYHSKKKEVVPIKLEKNISVSFK